MKVLLLSVPAGGGHYQTAMAIKEYLCQNKNTECEIVDVPSGTDKLSGEFISKGYVFTATHLSAGYRMVYNLSDKRKRHNASIAAYILDSVCGKFLTEYIDSYKPDVIISTHPFATVVVNLQAKKHKINAKLISIVTDLTIHPMWEQTTSDYVVVASERLLKPAEKKLGKDAVVLPLGIPIKSEFSQKIPKQDAREKMGIKDKFTVLVMMGSFGYANAAASIVNDLDMAKEDFQIVVVCGNNAKLKERLSAVKTNKDIKILGFYDDISTLMDACDCIITKPGGLSTSEALAKNLPMILTNPVPGHEDKNLKFLTEANAALALNKNFSAKDAVSKLISSPEALQKLIDNSKKLAKPNATRELAELVYKQ